MSVPFLDLKRQYETLQHELEPVALEALRCGNYIGGTYVTAFEEDMKAYLGVKHVIGCGNGTDALALALRACQVQPGDEVITTPFTFFASAEAIAAVGAVPVFVDVKETDFTIDPAAIEKKVTARTKAILPVHIFGMPCDMEAINAIAKKHGLRVIEDAAQAIGSQYQGKKIGNTENIASFSFYPTKNLGAFGDGGMVTTNDDELAIILRALREHGSGQNGAKARELLFGIRDDSLNSVAGATGADPLHNPYKYYNYLIGYNSRLDSVQAAMLSVKLKHLDRFNAARAAIGERYTRELQGLVGLPRWEVTAKPCYHQYAILTPHKKEMGQFLAERGIGSGAFYPVPLHLQKAFDHLGYQEGSLPMAERLCQETVCLPIFPELTEDEVGEVIQAVQAFVKTQA